MQPLDNQPAREIHDPTAEKTVEQPAQEFYEYTGESLSHTVSQSGTVPVEQNSSISDPGVEQHLSDEAIQQGLIYPPPPSFYQNMQVPPPAPPLPPPQAVPPVYPGNGPSGFNQAGLRPPMQANPPGPAMYQPYFPQPVQQTPVKRSRRWIWIVVTVLSLAFLVSCGLCSWAVYEIASPIFNQVSGSMNVVIDYYTSLQQKDYTSAYQDIAIGTLTNDQFTQQAQARDDLYGTIKSYSPGQPSVSSTITSDPNTTRVVYPVDITRSSLSYTALLTLNKVNNVWKITAFDVI